MYSEKSIHEYLELLSSKSPVPGGGSAAALLGAIGVALLCKVVNFTIGKPKYKKVEKKMRDILGKSEHLCRKFTELCSEDAIVYKRLAEAFKLPKGKNRGKRIQEGLKQATGVPLEICKEVHQAIKLSLAVAQKGNVNLITDVGIAGLIFNCTFKSALLNVEINLNSIKDNEFVLKVRRILKPLEKEVATKVKQVNTEVAKHVKK